jgi:type IV pilus assembly protein PilV
MRANESGLGSGYTNAAVLIGGGCPASIPKICSNHHYDGSAKTDAATDCTADEVATSDVWEVYCGYQNTDVVSNSSDNLELTAMNITCADSTGGICDDGTTFTVAVSWTAKAVESKTNTAESSAKSINLSFRP